MNIKVESSVKYDLFRWMRDKHIPEVMKTGLFGKVQLLSVAEDENGRITFQYIMNVNRCGIVCNFGSRFLWEVGFFLFYPRDNFISPLFEGTFDYLLSRCFNQPGIER